jgi:hypothetical protein
VALTTGRISRDLDVFSDTRAAVWRAWRADREQLETNGFEVSVVREAPGYVEADVRDADERLVVEWAQDSAFRFFPLVEHADLGLTLHPFDLATNKVLALVGRLEVRDWVDVIACHLHLQPLGLLAWAACGKDPGFTPAGILAHAGRSSRYVQADLNSLSFDGATPDAATLSRQWHEALAGATAYLDVLPAERAGAAVLTDRAALFRDDGVTLARALEAGRVVFHHGRIGGAWPVIKA